LCAGWPTLTCQFDIHFTFGMVARE
jgi:hypothetical protein